MIRSKTSKVLTALACFVMLFWLFGNLQAVRWNPDAEVVAFNFANTMNHNVPAGTKWNITSVCNGFPGSTVLLKTEVPQGKISVELQSFLGFGWLERRYDFDSPFCK